MPDNSNLFSGFSFGDEEQNTDSVFSGFTFEDEKKDDENVIVDNSLDLPEVTYKDVDLPEGKFIESVKKKLGGLGFTFEETGMFGMDFIPGDYVNITSPPDADGNTVTKRFSVDQWLGKRQGEADDINAFVKEHAGKSQDVDSSVYAKSWNYVNQKAQEQDLENLSSSELVDLSNNILADLDKSKDVTAITKRIEDGMGNFTKSSIIDLQKKHNTNTVEGRNAALEELNTMLSTEFSNRVINDSEYQKLRQSGLKAVQSYFGQDIEKQVREEGELEVMPGWVNKNPVLNSLVKGVWGTANIKLPKAKYDFTGLNSAKKLENISSEIVEFENMDPNATVRYDKGYSSDSKLSIPTKEYKASELVELLKRNKKVYEEKVAYNIIKSDGYQQKLSKITLPEIFSEDGVGVSGEEFGRIIGDQGVQMITAAFTLGGSTLIQEGGGAYSEITTAKAAMKMFPEMEKNKAIQAFSELDMDKKTAAITDLIEKGEGDLGTAFAIGTTNAGLDLVSNFIVLGKAAKFLPKSLGRDFLAGRYKEFLKGGWKTMGKDVTIGSFSEFVTETMQEGVNIFGVGTATGESLSDMATKENLTRLMEAGGQAIIATGPIISGGQVASTVTKEIASKVSAIKNPEHQRNYINQSKKQIDQEFKDGKWTRKERDDIFTSLESAEQSFNFENLDGKGRENVINNLTTKAQNDTKINQLEKQIQEQRKESVEAIGEETTSVIDEIELKELKKDNVRLNNNNIKEVFLSNYKNNGKGLANWVNEQKDGLFKDKEVVTFKTVKEAEKWISAAIKKGDIKSDKTTQQRIDNLIAGKTNGLNFGNTAIMVDENINKAIKKGDWSATNTIHHETLHYILDGMKTEELKTFRDQTINKMMASKDPMMTKVLEKTMERFNVYLNDPSYSENALNQEFFTSLSDAMTAVKLGNLNVENGSVLNDIGKAFQKIFSKNTSGSIDYSGLNAENTLEFIKKYNDFNGKGPKYQPISIKGGTDVKEREVKESKALYDQVNQDYNDFIDIDPIVAANLAANTLKGVVGTRVRSLVDKGDLKGFGPAEIADVVEEFTRDPEALSDDLKNRGLVGLINKYDRNNTLGPNKETVPLTGYLNSKVRGENLLNQRIKEFIANSPKFNNLQKSLQEEGVMGAVDQMTAEDTAMEKFEQEDLSIGARKKRKPAAKTKKEGVRLHEELVRRGFPEAKDIHDYLVAEYTKLYEAGKLEGMSMKDLKKIGMNLVQKMYGVKPKPGNLTKPDVKASQMAVKKLGKDFFVNYVLFNHFTKGVPLRGEDGKAMFDKNGDIKIDLTTKEKATGLPAVLQVERPTKANGLTEVRDNFYEEIKRGNNLKLKRLKKFDDEYFYEKTGILADDPNLYKKSDNISQIHRGFHTATLQVMSSQAARQVPGLSDRSLDMLRDGMLPPMESKAVKALNNEEFYAFFEGLDVLGNKIKPILPIYTKRYLREAMNSVYSDTLSKEQINAITNDIDKVIQPYLGEIKDHQKLNIKPEDFNKYLVREVLNIEADVVELTGATLNGKKNPNQTELYNDLNSIKEQRASVIVVGQYFVNKYGPEKGLRYLLAYMKPMYAGMSKIGDGRYTVDKDGNVVENKQWKPTKINKKGKEVPQDNRKQVFENVGDFINNAVNKIDGIRVESPKSLATAKFFYNNKEIQVDTKFLEQKSGVFINKIKKEGEKKVKELSKKEAKEARVFINDIITFFNEEKSLSPTNMAMMLISLNSGMKTPMRRAANLLYVTEGYESVKNPGSNLEYEHMIPANWMMLKTLQATLAEGGIKNLDKFYENYTVAIIPKSMDMVLKASGYNSTMPSNYKLTDPAWKRYYNNRTLGKEGIIAIREIGTKKLVGKNHQKASEIINTKKIEDSTTLNKAIITSRTPKESKGITVLDFDDTLATTKSGVRAKIPNMDGLPKPQRKVIFLAGGAGSGKGNVISKLGLKDQGFKIVNSDISLEWLKKNSGLPANMNDFTKEQRSKLGSLQYQARGIARRKQMKYQGEGNGVVVDGTGGSIKSMEKLVNEFKDKGYDVSMMFVETSLPVALERNAARKERSLLDKIVTKNHEAVQGNKDGFKTMFGDRFMEVNTDNLSQQDAMPAKLTEQMNDFVSGYENRRLDAEEFASEGADILEQGGTFDFSEFSKVVKGKTAPLFNKAMKLQGKFGPENMFVLTARPADSAPAIFEFLKANGLNIPLKNITGLANSTPEAKALWITDKVADGYNDFYFADDALQNVQAVKNMLDQFDVKSKVQQAKVMESKGMNENFNNILENITGIESKKRFSAIKARKRGESKGKFRFFIPPSHEDFVGLLYNFMGKGKEGNAHRDFFEKALIRPLNRAYRELNAAKQSIANDYKSLNKQFENVKKKLTKKTPDGDFTYQDAIRVYLWDKHGNKIPGLSPTDQQNLVDLVMSDPELQAYAETLNVISKQEKYVAPTESWEGGDARTDLDDATGRIGRGDFLAEFNENVDTIFSQENLNKIEAAYGADVVSAIKDMMYRIKTGQNRPSGQNKQTNQWLNYLNGSVAATMFFNVRSAVLQQMSLVNFINFGDNNIIAAAKAFANQKQYWTDWATIFNSDFMRQRRKGIQTDVNGAELAASVKGAKNPAQAVIKKLLELGFLPTQIGDNIAIATGGAAFLRNRINTYMKEGMSKKEAEAKAFVDFEILAEATQQSARPDMVSQQQASPLGKVILAFQNVTSQFNRLGKKAFLDIKNRRITPGNKTQMQSDMSNLSRIAYYFAIQNVIFYSLQSALFMAMFDDDEDDKRMLAKKERIVNGTLDSVLRGSGVWGAAISTLKNMAFAYHKEREKDWNGDEASVLVEALNVSPPLGIKARKIVNAERTLNYNRKTIDEMETFDIDNPQWSANTSYIEALTNVPLNRLYNKTMNVRESLNNQQGALERVLMFSGWSKWNLGVEDIEKEKKKQKFSTKKKRVYDWN